MNWLIGLLLLYGLLFPNSANAQRLEFSAGQTDYSSHDGIWYDSFYPFNNATNVGSQAISYTIPNWRFSFVHMGEATNTAEWGLHERVDEIANPSLIGKPTTGGAGYGDVFGISAGRTAEWQMPRGLIGVEGGLFLYRGEWHETTWRLDGVGARAYDDSTHINLTTYAGATARLDPFFVEYRVYYNIQNGLINHSARQILVGYSIPFGVQ